MQLALLNVISIYTWATPKVSVDSNNYGFSKFLGYDSFAMAEN